ncbi:cytochrome c553 [Rhodobium orientis]|uniref:Cytochrome c domain-containing protein n=1 Tax=Rhodobium orientis TaxID=34017 RepID=A0A327JUD5_9HYPH|nr:hypothetical protein [Rhodobium orientis]MBB4301127.1 cytochrome c553 [Rhodobium orientis]MBK5949791.1 hypothetical protein [Rhodobium orientis]RAI30099.1 hypothetical protein CH339_00780 [Rhodobium orientis]
MLRRLAALLAFLLLAVPPAAGAGGDEVKGLIADRCADCHLVAGYESRAADVGAPSFAVIAADKATYTEGRLRAYLQDPHWPMEQFVLSRSDIDHIVAYFAARGNQAE